MKKIKINKNKGILFFLTGLSGSGKSEISENIKNSITKKYGPTIVLSGDDIRKSYGFKGYTKKERITLGKNNIKFIKIILNQKINVIYNAIAMSNELRKIKKKNIKNYLEIYIKTNIKKAAKKKSKIYSLRKNIVGIDIKPEFPKSPDITIANNFNNSIKKISKELFIKIEKIIY
jgi:adenylylsulfate kinase|tara:strand:+ start:182 stop:706 length:525 start_codon:yes stop_codon:yes gene_type:complete